MTATTSLEWWEEDGGADELAGVAESNGAAELAGKVSLEGQFLDHDILKLSAGVADIQTPVLGAAFHLEYDAGTLSFLRYDPGEFLERGGDPFYLVTAMKDVLGQETGELIYGETLRRDDEFPVGEGGLAEFYFQQLDPSVDVYEFSFENGVVSTLDVVRQDIDQVEFEDLVLDGESLQNGVDDAEGLTVNVAGAAGEAGLGGWVLWIVFALALVSSSAIFIFLKLKDKLRQKKKFAKFYVGV